MNPTRYNTTQHIITHPPPLHLTTPHTNPPRYTTPHSTPPLHTTPHHTQSHTITYHPTTHHTTPHTHTFSGSNDITGSLDLTEYCCCCSSNSARDMISTVSLLSLGRDALLLVKPMPALPGTDADEGREGERECV